MVSSTGCWVSVKWAKQRMPIIPKPERPVMQDLTASELEPLSTETKSKIANNYDELIKYSKRLELTIDFYNDYAKAQNSESGFYNSIK